jgi:hypothetical protein
VRTDHPDLCAGSRQLALSRRQTSPVSVPGKNGNLSKEDRWVIPDTT